MRWVSKIIAICIIIVSLNTETGEDISDLKKLISTNEDTNMNGKIYKLAPNGDKPGLCDTRLLQ